MVRHPRRRARPRPLEIDRAAVVAKYVGETEKNLARIFAEADTADSSLLTDEADALSGRRT